MQVLKQDAFIYILPNVIFCKRLPLLIKIFDKLFFHSLCILQTLVLVCKNDLYISCVNLTHIIL